MKPFEIFLPPNDLADFVSGYVVIDEYSPDEVEIKSFETSLSLGVNLGKPFEFCWGPQNVGCEEMAWQAFDKPYLFADYANKNSFMAKGQIRLVFIVFTPYGLYTLLNDRHPVFEEPIFPLSRLGVPIFNLIVKRKLRFVHSNEEGLKIIEEELRRFFLKHTSENSDQENNNEFVTKKIHIFDKDIEI